MSNRLRFRAMMVLCGVLLAVIVATPAESKVRPIEMGSFFFDDNVAPADEIHANVGDQLTFVAVDNGRGTPHTVEIDELGIHSGNLATGKAFTTPPLTQPGRFYVYCKPHENRGHFTTLVVTGTATTTEPPTTTTTTSTTTPPTTTTEGSATTSEPPTTTTTPPTTTTTPPTTTTTPPTTTTTPPTSTTEGSATTSEPPSGESEQDPDPAARAPAEALAPIGVGTADLDSLGITEPQSPLEEALGRSIGGDGPWTRSVRIGLLALVPVIVTALAAGLQYRRRVGQSDGDLT